MQSSYRGLELREAHDIIFGTNIPNQWWVIHQGTNRTVISITGPWHRADAIVSELAALFDWSTIDDWDEDEVGVFAGGYLLEVEVPQYINSPEEWDDDVPYRDEPITSSLRKTG